MPFGDLSPQTAGAAERVEFEIPLQAVARLSRLKQTLLQILELNLCRRRLRPVHNRLKLPHHPHHFLVAVVNLRQLIAPDAISLDRAHPAFGWIIARVLRTLASPLHRSNFQHAS